jgi:hypothetical protein
MPKDSHANKAKAAKSSSVPAAAPSKLKGAQGSAQHGSAHAQHPHSSAGAAETYHTRSSRHSERIDERAHKTTSQRAKKQ